MKAPALAVGPAIPKHALHPQVLGPKEKTPSSSFSTRVIVGGRSVVLPAGSSFAVKPIKCSGTNKWVEFENADILPTSAGPSGATENQGGPCYENFFPGENKCLRRASAELETSSRPTCSCALAAHAHSMDNEPSAPYENINMDHISKLTGEGFAQELVIRALGISRNDIEMARDILQEFATRTTTASSPKND